MSDATLHEDNDTPKATDTDIKRSDADTPNRLIDSTKQAPDSSAQDAPKTPS